MSYAGEYGRYELCKHNIPRRNCDLCITEARLERGKIDDYGVLHADNGSGYCIGHIEKDPRWPDGDGRCTVQVRHCPVLNTPEQLAANKREDYDSAVGKARKAAKSAHAEYHRCIETLRKLMAKGVDE